MVLEFTYRRLPEPIPFRAGGVTNRETDQGPNSGVDRRDLTPSAGHLLVRASA